MTADTGGAVAHDLDHAAEAADTAGNEHQYPHTVLHQRPRHTCMLFMLLQHKPNFIYQS